jgi:hypothetical protein
MVPIDASAGTGGTTPGSGGSGPADGGGADGPAATGAGCAGVQATFCDDYEAQTAGAEPKGKFTVLKAKAGAVADAVTVDGGKAFSGKQSLHFKIAKPTGDTVAKLGFGAAAGLPLASNDIHVRAMVWMTQSIGGAHWDFSTAYGTDPLQDEDTLTQYTVGHMASHMMAVYQPGDDSVDCDGDLPVGKWVCLQWEFKGAADKSHLLDIKIDGTAVKKCTITKGGLDRSDWPATTWKAMSVGFHTFGGGNALDLWIDDLAFGDKDIPCPAAPAAP